MQAASVPKASRGSSRKSRQTRAAILVSAERRFADHGFDRTRLEDVAADVGIRRASIVYHFKDKAELYEAVVAELFDGLHAALEKALTSSAPPPERIRDAVTAWVEYVGARPALARVLLREVADGFADERPVLARHSAPVMRLVGDFLGEWKRADMPRLSHVDPAHAAATIGGATIFFVAALPRLLWDRGFDPLSKARLARHRRELLQITWHILGLAEPVEPAPR